MASAGGAKPFDMKWLNAWGGAQNSLVQEQEDKWRLELTQRRVQEKLDYISSKYGRWEEVKTYTMKRQANCVGGAVQEQVKKVWIPNEPDARVKDLCFKHNIETHLMAQLDLLLADRDKRQGTMDDDIRRLYHDLDRCANPNGRLVIKIKQIRDGTFVGLWAEPDPEIAHFQKKFKLDAEAVRRFSEAISLHSPDKRQDMYVELENHLTASANPSALMMTFLKKIALGESLGEVKGSGKGGKSKDNGRKGDDRGRDDRRDRDDRRRDDGDDRRQRYRSRSGGGGGGRGRDSGGGRGRDDDRGGKGGRDDYGGRDDRDRRSDNKRDDYGGRDDRGSARGSGSDRNYDREERDRGGSDRGGGRHGEERDRDRGRDRRDDDRGRGKKDAEAYDDVW